VSWVEILARLGAALAVGGLIGLNRELRNKPAGLRTHALVSLGAAVITLGGEEIAGAHGAPSPDAMSRVIQGIITGVGFLGAGVILRPREGQTVRGLTTAATVWISAGLGIAAGDGQWRLLLVGAALTLAVLVGGRALERRLLGEIRPARRGPEDPEGRPDD